VRLAVRSCGFTVGVRTSGRVQRFPAMRPDPQLDADYRALVEALAREGLPRRTEAVRAVEAVACALAQRAAGSEFDQLREGLPEPFRGRLVACEVHAAGPRGDLRTLEDFYGIVASDLDRRPDDVEASVRAVFAALRAQLPEQEAEDLGEHLPPELLPLWRRLS
jgi:uncharacterized protein (DUF2267 family)